MADCCSGDIKMIYSCSGAADVGELADRVSRRLRDEGFARMSCLAGIGAELSGYVQTAKGADVVLAIDGCATACARRSLERIGVSPTSIVVTDFGIEKGKAPVTRETIERLCASITEHAWTPQKERSGSDTGGGC